MSKKTNIEEYRPDFYLRSLSKYRRDIFAGVEALFIDNDRVLVDPKTGKYNYDAVYFLESARINGVGKFAIITNTLGRQEKKEKALNIRDYMQCETGIETIHLEALGMEERKPRPAGFIRAMEHLDIQNAPAVLMVDDQISSGIVGAKRLEMQTCLIDPFGSMEWISVIRAVKNWWILRQLQLQYTW